ncbi:MAG: hypothetical protein WDZ51_02580 [Pirellulaceae bacterium]
MATRVIAAAVHQEIENLPGFEESLVQEVEREYALLATSRRSELQEVEAKIQDLDRQKNRFMLVIRSGREGLGCDRGKTLIRAKMDLHLVAIFPELAEIPSIDQEKYPMAPRTLEPSNARGSTPQRPVNTRRTLYLRKPRPRS